MEKYASFKSSLAICMVRLLLEVAISDSLKFFDVFHLEVEVLYELVEEF